MRAGACTRVPPDDDVPEDGSSSHGLRFIEAPSWKHTDTQGRGRGGGGLPGLCRRSVKAKGQTAAHQKGKGKDRGERRVEDTISHTRDMLRNGAGGAEEMLAKKEIREGGGGGLCLKGRGANGAVPGRLPSGHRGCDSGWGGGYWRLEMRLGLGLRYGNAFGINSRPECLGGRGTPPPSSDIVA